MCNTFSKERALSVFRIKMNRISVATYLGKERDVVLCDDPREGRLLSYRR